MMERVRRPESAWSKWYIILARALQQKKKPEDVLRAWQTVYNSATEDASALETECVSLEQVQQNAEMIWWYFLFSNEKWPDTTEDWMVLAKEVVIFPDENKGVSGGYTSVWGLMAAKAMYSGITVDEFMAAWEPAQKSAKLRYIDVVKYEAELGCWSALFPGQAQRFPGVNPAPAKAQHSQVQLIPQLVVSPPSDIECVGVKESPSQETGLRQLQTDVPPAPSERNSAADVVRWMKKVGNDNSDLDETVLSGSPNHLIDTVLRSLRISKTPGNTSSVVTEQTEMDQQAREVNKDKQLMGGNDVGSTVAATSAEEGELPDYEGTVAGTPPRVLDCGDTSVGNAKGNTLDGQYDMDNTRGTSNLVLERRPSTQSKQGGRDNSQRGSEMAPPEGRKGSQSEITMQHLRRNTEKRRRSPSPADTNNRGPSTSNSRNQYPSHPDRPRDKRPRYDSYQNDSYQQQREARRDVRYEERGGYEGDSRHENIRSARDYDREDQRFGGGYGLGGGGGYGNYDDPQYNGGRKGTDRFRRDYY